MTALDSYLRRNDLPRKFADILQKGSDWTLLRLSEHSWSIMETYTDDEVLLRQCYYALRVTFWSEVFMTMDCWDSRDERDYKIAMQALHNGLQAIGPASLEQVRMNARSWINGLAATV